tara:strand:- start:480 stop:932 length:453 start_codon:yes stop_codon:yes gene_type:complete
MSVKVESVDTRGGFLLGATFNDAAIIYELELHGFEIDAIQSVDETSNTFDVAVFHYCEDLKSIMNKMLGSSQYRSNDAEDDMCEAWLELVGVVEGLLDKIKNEIGKSPSDDDESSLELAIKLDEIGVVCNAMHSGGDADRIKEISAIVNS